jgi:hypothetical protein
MLLTLWRQQQISATNDAVTFLNGRYHGAPHVRYTIGRQTESDP